MKKVLSTVAALGLVVGFAATASALDVPAEKTMADTALPMAISGEHFGITGDWSLAGVTINNASTSLNGAAANLTMDSASDSVYIHTFRIDPTLRINDKIQVKGHLRFMDREVFGGAAQSTASGRAIDLRQIYMEYASPVGKIQAGRMAAGAWGSDFLSTSAQAARIRWYPSFVSSPWSMLLFIQQTEADAANGLVSDGDSVNYYAGITHAGDMGKTDLALSYTRNGSTAAGADAAWTNGFLYNGSYNIEGFSVMAELNYVIGDNGVSGLGSMDTSAFGFMLDVGMKAGEADLGLMYAYASGDDDATDNDNNAIMSGTNGLGADFNPFVILTGDYTGILNGDKNGIAVATSNGASLLALHGAMKVNDKLTVNGTIGTAWANETATGIDDQYGWEVDLGASYALYNNLSYGVHFGYLATGDFFEAGGTATTEDVVMLAHQLTMKF